MYCPNCAAPINGVKFCRSCGANVSLVQEAMTGRLETVSEDKPKRGRHRKDQKTPTIEGAMSSIFTGLGFLFVSFAVLRFFPGGRIWWFWMLIPAFACLGEGIGKYLRLKSEQKRMAAPLWMPPQTPAQMPAQMPEQPAQQPQIKAPTTSSLQAPAGSITEGTTRNLDPARRAD
jgi:hypothetical protein